MKQIIFSILMTLIVVGSAEVQSLADRRSGEGSRRGAGSIGMVDLSKGLFLENSGLLIPWGVTIEEAWLIGNPKPWNLPDDKTRIKWDKAVILGGMECVIQTYFPTANARLSQFNIMDAYYHENLPVIWADKLKAQCEKLFGRQAEHKVWRQKNIALKICHDDRFVEAYWLQIVRETD